MKFNIFIFRCTTTKFWLILAYVANVAKFFSTFSGDHSWDFSVRTFASCTTTVNNESVFATQWSLLTSFLVTTRRERCIAHDELTSSFVCVQKSLSDCCQNGVQRTSNCPVTWGPVTSKFHRTRTIWADMYRKWYQGLSQALAPI